MIIELLVLILFLVCMAQWWKPSELEIEELLEHVYWEIKWKVGVLNSDFKGGNTSMGQIKVDYDGTEITYDEKNDRCGYIKNERQCWAKSLVEDDK